MRLLLMALVTSTAGAQDPGPGIDRALAEERAARVSEVRYELWFDLQEGRDEVEGEVVLSFALPEHPLPPAPVVLDFGGELRDARVNEVPTDVRRVHDHVILPPDSLGPGRNQFRARFTSRVAATGTPLTVFRDPAREEEYLYTLVVPADAHRLFPCFDQPDLKAVVALRLTVPPDWVAVANGAEVAEPEITAEGKKQYEFEDTAPISTYLVAFAAGPFAVRPGGSGVLASPMRLFVRQSRLGDLEPGAVEALHHRSLRWLEDYFGRAYPFGKLDVVLLPGFPYGGMEHAGAIFYRESALVFDHAPTESELVRRSTLVYHEVSHQWFGNLVTMQWFDDLWLKEGFATFVGYHLLAALEPERNAWLRFHQRVKPAAYRIDATPGTTPIYQELHNLDHAKSAYGPIVYNKAPAVLRELHERLGGAAFRDGVRLFLGEHAFGNATWSDLVRALEQASRADLGRWSDRWILAAGMPRVRLAWEVGEGGAVARCELLQESVQGGGGVWPMVVDLLWTEPGGGERTVSVASDGPSTPVEAVVGLPEPLGVLPNASDVAYGQFLLDPRSREHWLRRLPDEADPLRRAVALRALYDTVREAELEPARFAELLIALLERERDPLTHASLLVPLATTLGRYLHAADRGRLGARVTALLLGQLRRGMPGLELQTFRFLARHGTGDEVLELCAGLLDGEAPVPGLTLGQEDRYLALAALVAAGRAGGRVAAMTGAATPAGAEKHAFVALAAAPDAATKERYFAIYLQPDEPPEQWMQESLDAFHWPGQEDLTLPYLRKALDRVEWVGQNRKIFFMPAWIDAFVGAHATPEALQIVRDFLADHPRIPADVRRKVLQSADGLRRAVDILERWP